MNKRDSDKLDGLLLVLTAHFSDMSMQSFRIYRGDARAIVAVIRERNKMKESPADERERRGSPSSGA